MNTPLPAPPDVTGLSGLWLVYDGDCPFCSTTARMYRLKKAAGELHVLDARQAGDHPLMTEIHKRGLDLNKDIAASYEGRIYHGADALHLLALLGSDNDGLNRLNAALFRHRRLVGFAYPVMRGVRDLSLKALGRQPL